MGHSNGRITAPVSISDVSSVLGVSTRDVGYLCSNVHGKTNRYSFAKPYAVAGIGTYPAIKNKVDYVKSVRLKTYTIGDPAPATALADYAAPKGGVSEPYRLTDFDGYEHYDYPHTCDLSSISGTTIDTDYPNKSFQISYRHSGGQNLFQYLVNADRIISQGNISGVKLWFFGLLVIAKYGSDTRYYLGMHSLFNATSINFPRIPADISIRKELIDIDISKYACTVLAVAWTYDNQIEEDQDINTQFTNKIPSDRKYKFTILPQVGAINPIATNVKLTKPRNVVRVLVVLLDHADNLETYFPNQYAVQALLNLKIGNDTIRPDLTTSFDATNKEGFYYGYENTPLYGRQGWTMGEFEYFTDSNPMTASAQMVAGHEINPLDKSQYLKAQVTGNFDSSRDDGQGMALQWNERNLKDYTNETCYFILGVAFPDPYYRPDDY